MSSKLRMGIVGAGNIFQFSHAKTLMEHEEVEVVAICDINRARAEQVAQKLGVALCFEDYKELLLRDDIDAIDICTPNVYHSIISIAALQAGKHVFCEKPDAVNPAEAQKMADAAKASGKILMTMRNNRFTPAAQFLKRHIRDGGMGEIYTGRCGWIRRRGIPGKGGWFTTKELSGGGPLIDLGVHYIDLAVWLMGNPKAVAVSGCTYTKFANNEISDSIHSQFGEKKASGTFDVEDSCIGFIRFENGASLQFEFSWASNIGEEMNFVELRGTQSGFSLKKGEVEIFSESAGELTNMKPVIKKEAAPPHGEHLKHFIDCVQQRAEPIMAPEQGVEMIKLLSAIYESASSGREVRLV
ncbi:gfo/Idh/MocA family oxidoreductase [Paenibacillus sp. LMG 31460]|uniref:Gfo/Idh/MocA family oxidoreductase n=1 Tax=Paenibacillus germinis TaxID=2654979 RepID=A0ABX1Z7N9_9BACL|nr:Gfo/Idh/MocA family oxidoreductase [Paenibacillus germinis]NOU88314.1 gfo/Idh/MocA family oxidoreductase [Paenibacillus germinis]